MQTGCDQKTATAVLLVEDDEATLELQASLIADRFPAIMLYTAVNGKMGLELFQAHTPAIVVTDINMVEMCGMQLADSIRAIKPDTKLIAISGKTGEAGNNGKFYLKNAAGKHIEFDYFIIKPVVLTELFSIIDKCMDEIAQQASNPGCPACY